VGLRTFRATTSGVLCLVFLVAVRGTLAQCIRGPSASDRAVWALQNCWWDFVLWQYKAYRMWNDNWGSWGFNDACNLRLEYPKAFNASFVLTYGLPDDQSLQWHGTIDYRRAGEAWGTEGHGTIYYMPSTSRSWLAQAETGRFLAEDRTKMGCLLFDSTATTGVPSTRSGDYVHEGWHHWQHKYGYDPSHMNGPVGSCTMTGNACDWYYWHTVGQYAFGEMWKYTSDGRFFHSPNQSQVEYLCDIGELGTGWVPTVVEQLARAEANQRLGSRFRNAVGYRCGDPRPW
jgi:hypothetical protein